MAFNARFKHGSASVLVIALAALFLTACGGGPDESLDHTGGTAVAFQVVWDRPASNTLIASLTDCGDVATVRAVVHNAAGDLLGGGGPWNCSAGSGVIAGLPANYYATIGVGGYGADGSLLYFGENSAPVFLQPGTVDAGVITAGPFVPVLASPPDGSPAAMGALVLQWNRLAGAEGYRVAISTDNSFSSESVVWSTDIADGDVTSTGADTTGLSVGYSYYWRVQAFYDDGRLSDPSTAWLFTLRTLTITGVTLVDNGAAGIPTAPIATIVSYLYSSMVYSQVQAGLTIDQWSAEMTPADYFEFQDLISEYELLYQDDVTATEGPCTGWGGMTITIFEAGGSSYQFAISGLVCNRNEWPPGVRALVELSEAMVAAYQP